MPLRTGVTRPISLLLPTAIAAGTLTGSALLDLAAASPGTAARVKALAAPAVLSSRPVRAPAPAGVER
ncbi:hypothetical protein DTB58_22935, partial [Streptomyces griseus]|nr:hypothetical protein [Streptomyces griseus]